MTRRRVIGLLSNNAGLGHDYQAELRRGVERACADHDLDLWVYAGHNDWTPTLAQREVYRLMSPTRVDGIVLASGCIAASGCIVGARLLDRVLEIIRARCPVPMCAIGQFCPGVGNIVIDSESGVGRLIAHLIRDHGRQRFVYIAGPSGHDESEERLRATRAVLGLHGLSLPADAIAYGDFSNAAGRDRTRELLERGAPIDTVIAANDEMALGALELLASRGIKCPEDVAVAGFDDALAAGLSDPPLTTVRQPLVRAGAAAVSYLMSAWGGGATDELFTVETELVVRESCGCRPTQLSLSGGKGSSLDPIELNRGAREGSSPEADLVELLVPLLDSQKQREEWADRLKEAVLSERAGDSGATPRAFELLLSRLHDPHVPIHELQRVITGLHAWSSGQGASAMLDEAFHAARALIGGHAYRRIGQQNLRCAHLVEQVRVHWERLATSLSLEALRQVLVCELPRIYIQNAFVALYLPGSPQMLAPLLCLRDGVSQAVGEPFRSDLLMPSDAFDADQRQSLTVFALTYESEQLGVAVLELPFRADAYSLLREQIGSAVKAVRQHEEILNRERLHAEAQQEKRATAERLRSLSLVAGGVAHDLNNVLGPLMALPDTIRKDLEQTCPAAHADALEDLDTICQATQRATQTIRDLLSLGRSGELPNTTVELNCLVENERRTLLTLCARGENIDLRIETAQEPVLVHASRSHLARALSNLVINAVDAIHGSGTVVVRVSNRVVSERLGGVDPVDPGQYAVIEVQDTGSGIAEEYLPHIFEPFFTAGERRSSTGTGLGLAIVHRFMKDSKGYVGVRTELGLGATFALYFPVVVAARPEQEGTQASVGGRERVLVVDDEPVQLRTARRVLERLGYSVSVAQSGEEALANYASVDPKKVFDLVIVDMIMPGHLDGISTIVRLRQIRPRQKALVTSGYAPEEMERRSAEHGLPWLPKPYTPAALAAAVRSALDAPATGGCASTRPLSVPEAAPGAAAGSAAGSPPTGG